MTGVQTCALPIYEGPAAHNAVQCIKIYGAGEKEGVDTIMMTINHGEHIIRIEIRGTQGGVDSASVLNLSAHNAPSHRVVIDVECLREHRLQRMRQRSMLNIVQQGGGKE